MNLSERTLTSLFNILAEARQHRLLYKAYRESGNTGKRALGRAGSRARDAVLCEMSRNG